MPPGCGAVRGERVEHDPFAGSGARAGLGGDRRSGRIEAHAALILAPVEEMPDITLDELKAALAERGLSAGYGTLWRFFDRRRIRRQHMARPVCKLFRQPDLSSLHQRIRSQGARRFALLAWRRDKSPRTKVCNHAPHRLSRARAQPRAS